MENLQAAAGFAALIVCAWILSDGKRRFPLHLTLLCIVLQVGLAAAFIHLPGMASFLSGLNDGVTALGAATRARTSVVLGYAGGGPTPFEGGGGATSFILAFQALPVVLVISALTALLFHWGIIQAVVRLCAWALRRTLGIGGTEAVSAAANVFIGMVEAPILVAPYLKRLDRSGLFLIMTVGMATIAGTVFGIYAGFLSGVIPGAAGHLFAASIISLPAAIMIARIMVPVPPEVVQNEQLDVELSFGGEADGLQASNMMDAISRGTAAGVKLLISIIALLLVLVALVSLADMIMAAVLPDVSGAPLSIERIFTWIFAPVAYAMGIPWAEAGTAGALLGTKTALNELLAYLALSQLPPDALSPRSELILTYALCGFANFGSLGIMLGGLTAMVPERRADLVRLAPRSLISGTLATCLTGATVGILV